MKIIKAQTKDFPAVQKIFKEYQEQLNTPICFQNFKQELDNLQSVYASPTGAIFLVFDDDRVIACVAFCPHKTLSKKSETAELKRLYVQDDYKGQGVGKKLFIRALNEAQKQGYKSIVLETMDNMKQATSLYLQHGFKLIPPFSPNTDSDVKCYRYDFH